MRSKLAVCLWGSRSVLEFEKEQFKLEFTSMFETFRDRQDRYRSNKAKAAALLWKQCSTGMRAKLQARTDFNTIEKNPILLLKAIKEHSMNVETTQYKMKTVIDTMRNFVNTRQRHEETLNEYLERFKAAKNVFFSHVGTEFEKLVKEDPSYHDVMLKKSK